MIVTSDMVEVVDLGRIDYTSALELQRRFHEEVVGARGGDHSPMKLLLLEHDPPVVTIGRHPGAAGHLLADPETLRARNVQCVQTDRGGDITWHGPGQLVAYPIIDMNLFGLRIHGYMRLLEQVVIETITGYGLEGTRDSEAPGVWVGDSPTPATCPKRKICAVGVRVSRWVTMHGLALNVDPDLGFYDMIVPCGLAGRGVSSISSELDGSGTAPPTMDQVKDTLAATFKRVLDSRDHSSGR